jgi:hypothetical protein
VDVDVRLIDIETNRMLLGASATITKDQVVANLLASGRQEASLPPPSGLGVGSLTAPPESKSVSIGGFLFQVRGCRWSGGELVCTVTLTNEGAEEREVSVNTGYALPSTRLVDNRGNQYPVEKVLIGGRGGHYSSREKFVPHLPVNVDFVTRNVRADATNVSLVIHIDRSGKGLVLRDMPIAK